jgi:hypothetical protein
MLMNQIPVRSRRVEWSAKIKPHAVFGGIECLTKKEQTLKDGRFSCVVATEDEGQWRKRYFTAVGEGLEVQKPDSR